MNNYRVLWEIMEWTFHLVAAVDEVVQGGEGGVGSQVHLATGLGVGAQELGLVEQDADKLGIAQALDCLCNREYVPCQLRPCTAAISQRQQQQQRGQIGGVGALLRPSLPV